MKLAWIIVKRGLLLIWFLLLISIDALENKSDCSGRGLANRF